MSLGSVKPGSVKPGWRRSCIQVPRMQADLAFGPERLEKGLGEGVWGREVQQVPTGFGPTGFYRLPTREGKWVSK